uniref:Transposase n=1 Tax=Ascaris lumbricoides TaxID=6252 RepID=A0A0M3I731_ASCLU
MAARHPDIQMQTQENTHTTVKTDARFLRAISSVKFEHIIPHVLLLVDC